MPNLQEQYPARRFGDVAGWVCFRLPQERHSTGRGRMRLPEVATAAHVSGDGHEFGLTVQIATQFSAAPVPLPAQARPGAHGAEEQSAPTPPVAGSPAAAQKVNSRPLLSIEMPHSSPAAHPDAGTGQPLRPGGSLGSLRPGRSLPGSRETVPGRARPGGGYNAPMRYAFASFALPLVAFAIGCAGSSGQGADASRPDALERAAVFRHLASRATPSSSHAPATAR
jgi:hypothetical protein